MYQSQDVDVRRPANVFQSGREARKAEYVMEELITIKKQQKKLPSRFPSGIQAGHYQAPLSRSSGEIGVFCPNSIHPQNGLTNS